MWLLERKHTIHSSQHCCLYDLLEIFTLLRRGDFNIKPSWMFQSKYQFNYHLGWVFVFADPNFLRFAKLLIEPQQSSTDGLISSKALFVLIEAGSHRNVLVIKMILCVVSIKVWYMTQTQKLNRWVKHCCRTSGEFNSNIFSQEYFICDIKWSQHKMKVFQAEQDSQHSALY